MESGRSRHSIPDPPLWELVGGTPLIPLRGEVSGRSRLLLKAEWLNPGGSVKDRAAREILRQGLRQGELPAHRLLDASSGNTAVAYAMLGAPAGIGITVCVPTNVSAERLALLQAYGAEIIATDPLEGSDGAILRAQELAASEPARFWYADQYNNQANECAHYSSTGPEIWDDTAGSITHFVAGVGTSGTLMGVARFLKERNAGIRIVAVQPESGFHGLEGLKHMASAIVPGIYDPSRIDETVFVSTEAAEDAVSKLAREQGLFLGWSSGASILAARKILDRERARGVDATVVAVAPDGGTRYLSEDRCRHRG